MLAKQVRQPFAIFLLALSFLSLLSSCAMNKTQKTALIGSAAGTALGVMIGKRAGNSAVGATIGAALGGSTGAFIGRRLDNLSDNKNKTKIKPPLYVINGELILPQDLKAQLGMIQSDRIESIEVLNTTDAVAKYGTRGNYGAVLIYLRKI